MEKLDRVKAAFDCQPTDRVPVYDLIRNDRIIEYFAGEKIDMKDPAPSVYKAYSRSVDATKQAIAFPREVLQTTVGEAKHVHTRWTSWTVHPKQYDQQRLKRTVTEIIHRLRSEEDLVPARVQRQVEEFYFRQAKVRDTVLFASTPSTGIGLYQAYQYCGGVDMFSYLYYDDKEVVYDLVNSLYLYSMKCINALPSTFSPVAVVIAGDIAFKGGLLFSPALLDELLLPYLAEMTAAYHERNIKVVFHSDGDLSKYLRQLVDCGIDGLHPLENGPNMDIKRIRKSYPRLVLFGGIDCSQLLPFGTAEEVYNVARRNIQDAKYGYFIGSSSEVNNEVPLENFLAMREVAML